MYADTRRAPAPTAPAPTARAELPRRDATPSTCGWVTDISVQGGDGDLRGYMPLTCAPGLTCGSINSARGCCSDAASCANEVAVYCFDSTAISTASPTTGPVLYCSDPARPSCVNFWFQDNFYTSFACAGSGLYDAGTQFEVVPITSVLPTTEFGYSDVVTTFTSFLTDATPAAITSGSSTPGSSGSSSQPSSGGLPTWAIAVIAAAAGLLVLSVVLEAYRRWRRNNHQQQEKEQNMHSWSTPRPPQPPLLDPPPIMQTSRPSVPHNLHSWQADAAAHSHPSAVNTPGTPPASTWGDGSGPADDATVFSLAPTGIGSEFHGNVPHFR